MAHRVSFLGRLAFCILVLNVAGLYESAAAVAAAKKAGEKAKEVWILGVKGRSALSLRRLYPCKCVEWALLL